MRTGIGSNLLIMRQLLLFFNLNRGWLPDWDWGGFEAFKAGVFDENRSSVRSKGGVVFWIIERIAGLNVDDFSGPL